MNNRLSYECIELSYECTELSYEYCFEQLGEQRISHSNHETSSEISTGYEQSGLSFMPLGSSHQALPPCEQAALYIYFIHVLFFERGCIQMEHQLIINAPLCLSTFDVMMSYEEAL